MHTISQWLNKILEFVVAALVAVTVLVVLWGVFSRFIVNVPSRWTEGACPSVAHTHETGPRSADEEHARRCRKIICRNK